MDAGPDETKGTDVETPGEIAGVEGAVANGDGAAAYDVPGVTDAPGAADANGEEAALVLESSDEPGEYALAWLALELEADESWLVADESNEAAEDGEGKDEGEAVGEDFAACDVACVVFVACDVGCVVFVACDEDLAACPAWEVACAVLAVGEAVFVAVCAVLVS